MACITVYVCANKQLSLGLLVSKFSLISLFVFFFIDSFPSLLKRTERKLFSETQQMLQFFHPKTERQEPTTISHSYSQICTNILYVQYIVNSLHYTEYFCSLCFFIFIQKLVFVSVVCTLYVCNERVQLEKRKKIINWTVHSTWNSNLSYLKLLSCLY